MNLSTAQLIRRFSFEEWGGTENVVWNSVQELANHQIDSDIFATRALSSAGDESRNNIDIRRFRYFYPYFPMPAARKAILDKKGGNPISISLAHAFARGNYDLLHMHTTARRTSSSE